MPSFFSKFAGGAAEAGAGIIADRMKQEMISDLTAKRDATLEGYRTTREKTRQKFEIEKIAEQREFVKTTPQAKLAEIKLESAEDIQDLKTQYITAETDKQRDEVVRKIMLAQGKPVETILMRKETEGVKTKYAKDLVKYGLAPNMKAALDIVWGRDTTDAGTTMRLAIKIADLDRKTQESVFIRPGTEGFKDFKTMLTEARKTVEEVFKGPISTPSPVGGDEIDFVSADDVKPGERIIVNNAGIRMVKREGKWRTIR